jgi:nitrogen fixation/metabolism regulation signal transduction histidine kinase
LSCTQELGRSKAYIDSIVESMGAGLITLGTDERIAVCNRVRGDVLGLPREEVEGADLRALPSPLGDMLYAGADRAEGDADLRGGLDPRGAEDAARLTTCVQ